MGRITGLEDADRVPPKVKQMYLAVIRLLEEGADASGIRVSVITENAGIGKGTAYEYFDSKEEIVACAVTYQVQCVMRWLESTLSEREGFAEQLNLLLDEMSVRDGRKYSFLRFVHLLTDNSEFSRLVREKVDREEFSRYRPENVFGRILKKGVERGELRDDLPFEYLIYCVFSHLVSYMMTLIAEDCSHVDPQSMRPLIYRGILNEIGKNNF